MKIETSDNTVIVTSDYNEAFIAQARKLGGRWDRPSWVFPGEVETEVRALCLECYGDDGNGVGETVTLRLTFPNGAYGKRRAIIVGGREIARAWGRDSGAKWGAGVICRTGDADSGGSVKNWKTFLSPGTVVDLLRVPKSLVDKFDGLHENGWIGKEDEYTVEVLGAQIDRSALIAEQTKLLARLAEIEAALAEASDSAAA